MTGQGTRRLAQGRRRRIASASRQTVNCLRPPRGSNRRTMPRHATATNVTPNGPATWCTSAKRASPLPRTSSRTSTRRRPRSMRRSARPPSSRPSSTRRWLRGDHLVDAAYIAAALLVSSHDEQGITLRGPTRPNPNWQAKVEGAYTVADFVVDWERQQVHCPQGKTATSWAERSDARGTPYIQVRFRQQDCRGCAARTGCTQAPAQRHAP